MSILKKTIRYFPLGIWIALIALFSTFLAWIMQAYSLYDWEEAFNFGFQNGSFRGDSLSRAMATKERGEAVADLLWVLPLNIIAIGGIMKKKFVGFVAAMMTFAICVYFPLFYVFQLWDKYMMTAIGAVILWGIPSLLGIIGLWLNRKTFNPQ